MTIVVIYFQTINPFLPSLPPAPLWPPLPLPTLLIPSLPLLSPLLPPSSSTSPLHHHCCHHPLPFYITTYITTFTSLFTIINLYHYPSPKPTSIPTIHHSPLPCTFLPSFSPLPPLVIYAYHQLPHNYLKSLSNLLLTLPT